MNKKDKLSNLKVWVLIFSIVVGFIACHSHNRESVPIVWKASFVSKVESSNGSFACLLKVTNSRESDFIISKNFKLLLDKKVYYFPNSHGLQDSVLESGESKYITLVNYQVEGLSNSTILLNLNQNNFEILYNDLISIKKDKTYEIADLEKLTPGDIGIE